ncbi:hypothetical protein CASFOL_034841 [Castilleja foliolosa]|uniref:Protein SHORT-ROOT-like n=1 Tax=Castilleja foliolosa TaxID=1961234 RepID=A0ABD3BS58_9LAMI
MDTTLKEPISLHSITNNPKSKNGSLDHPRNDPKWSSKLLRDYVVAMMNKDSRKAHHLLWMLNELASPYGDRDQKLASYFLQALFCKAMGSGPRTYKTLTSISERNISFDSVRRLMLKFQEVSPWTTFGHVVSNGAMLETFEGSPKLHIIDMSNTLCTQWPTLLEALATRNDETPRLKLTVVVTTTVVESFMIKEIAPRMEKFARLMGVPFEFTIVKYGKLGELTKEGLGVREDEALAVNCIGVLTRVNVEERSDAIRMICSLRPKIVTIVEEEADFSSSRVDFGKCFEECLRFYAIYLDMLEESFGVTSNEKLTLERECSRSIVRVLGCDDDDEVGGDSERRERGSQWSERLRESGLLVPVGYSDDVVDDVKALLKRYKDGWSFVVQGEKDDDHRGLYLKWKEENVVWASVWKPSKCKNVI